MNQFPLEFDEHGNPCPFKSAKSNFDKHIVKIPLEVTQMVADAAIYHGATPDMMPLTKAGTPYRGGYTYHPMTKWVRETKENYLWACYHGAALMEEFTKRYGSEHACELPLEQLFELSYLIPDGPLTEMPQCMPDEYKVKGCTVTAYRLYYAHDKARIARWDKGRPAPKWYEKLRSMIV